MTPPTWRQYFREACEMYSLTPEQVGKLTPYQARLLTCPVEHLSSIVSMPPAQAKAVIAEKRARREAMRLARFGNG